MNNTKNQNQPQMIVEEIKPDRNQLLDEKIKSEQQYIDILRKELTARTKRRPFIKPFPLYSARNEKAIFKLNVEIMAKMNFIANVKRLKTPNQKADGDKANLEIAK